MGNINLPFSSNLSNNHALQLLDCGYRPMNSDNHHQTRQCPHTSTSFTSALPPGTSPQHRNSQSHCPAKTCLVMDSSHLDQFAVFHPGRLSHSLTSPSALISIQWLDSDDPKRTFATICCIFTCVPDAIFFDGGGGADYHLLSWDGG
jgi:hypothetical protein